MVGEEGKEVVWAGYRPRISPSVTDHHPVRRVGTIARPGIPGCLPAGKMVQLRWPPGCTIGVSRPADQTPLTLILMFECMADRPDCRTESTLW